MPELKKTPRVGRGAMAHRMHSRGVEIWVSMDIPEATDVINNLSVPFTEENDNHPLVVSIQYMVEDAEAPLERIEVHASAIVGIYRSNTNKMCMVAVRAGGF